MPPDWAVKRILDHDESGKFSDAEKKAFYDQHRMPLPTRFYSTKSLKYWRHPCALNLFIQTAAGQSGRMSGYLTAIMNALNTFSNAALAAFVFGLSFGSAQANVISGSLWHVPEAITLSAVPANVPATTPDVVFAVNSPMNFFGTSTTVGTSLNNGSAFNLETAVGRARWCVWARVCREATTRPTGVGKEERQRPARDQTCQRVRSGLTQRVTPIEAE